MKRALIVFAAVLFMASCEEEESATCDDGVQNGTETAVDCGGDCTPCYSCGTPITDVDGNSYNTVQIGNQCWMQENLNTAKYNDGSVIPHITIGNWEWLNNEEHGWGYYDDDASYGTTYGKLYNGRTLENTVSMCPEGWHVPSEGEWSELISFLGDTLIAGGKMKSTGVLWESPNSGATNSSGFTALPAGYLSSSDGVPFDEGEATFFWSSSTVVAEAGTSGVFVEYPIRFELQGNTSVIESSYVGRGAGLSCRCVMD